MSNDAFRSIKRVCYAGLDTITLRREIALRVAPIVPYDAYAFSTTDPDTGLLTHTVAEGVPGPMMLAYCSHYYPFEAALVVLDIARTAQSIFSLWDQVPDLRSAMRSSGLRYDVHVALADRSGYWGDWCIMRESGARSEKKQHAFLKRILPHITHGLRTGTLIDVANSSTAADTTVATPCVLILDPRSQPQLRAGPADAILDDLADVGMQTPHRLPSSIINAAARVRRRASIAPAADAVLRVRGKSGRWYTVQAMLGEPDPNGDSSVVVVIRPMAVREKAVMLTQLYGLSAREREVTAAIARGESTKRVAARLQISPHTVKEHLDRACAKIGVHGRKALVARLFLDATAH